MRREKVKTNHPNHGQLNALLLTIEREYHNKLLKAQTDNLAASVKSISNTITGRNVADFYQLALQIQERYLRQGSIGSSDKVKSITAKVKHFAKTNSLPLSDIDVAFLKRYEGYCVTVRGNKANTIHKDMKFIRQVFNMAIQEGLVNLSDNPFGRFKPKLEKTTRCFLTAEELDRIENLSLGNPIMERHRDIFVFCCYAGGMRISDALMLRNGDVCDGRVQFVIRKTGEQITNLLPGKALAIYNKHLNGGKTYLFGLISDYIEPNDPIAIDRAISGATAAINKSLKIIAKEASIQKVLSSHVARHTFATLALQKEIPLPIVQRILGHANIRETQIYAKVIDRAIDEALKKFD